MATALRVGSRVVKREVDSRRHGPLIVTLTPEGVVLREKGRRKSFMLPYGAAYQQAAAIHAASEKRLKAERRKARREAR